MTLLKARRPTEKDAIDAFAHFYPYAHILKIEVVMVKVGEKAFFVEFEDHAEGPLQGKKQGKYLQCLRDTQKWDIFDAERGRLLYP